MTSRLTEPKFWESRYTAVTKGHRLKRWIPTWLYGLTRNYSDYLLWGIYKRYLKADATAKVLEVGSAPGTHLLALHDQFSFIPYGVEYSNAGVRLQKDAFTKRGFGPAHTIHADFFSAEFQQHNAGAFDIVISRGFIEHFTDVEDVVCQHVALLKVNGTLITVIPNFQGINLALGMMLNADGVRKHNRSIMNLERFRNLFLGLEPLWCAYLGTFNLNLWSQRRSRIQRAAVRALWNLQLPVNFACRLLFRDRGLEGRYWSPYLIFIGRKRSAIDVN